MKTSLVSFALASAVAAASAAVPTVESVSVAQDAVGGKVTVSYRLTDADAIVTIDLQTNALADATGAWVSVGDRNLTTLVGDVNQLVTASDTAMRTACWFPDREPFAGKNLGQVRAVVRPWTEKQPPDYLVLDLEAMNARRYYTSADALPDGGLTNKIYRKSRLVMRRIPAAGQTFRMGATPEEQAYYGKKDGTAPAVGVPHLVSFTNDYYMAVYPTTQSQYTNIVNKKVTFMFGQYADSYLRPADAVSLKMLRGTDSEAAEIIWPKTLHRVADGSSIRTLRDRCGLEGLDLPTDAQWEFACRGRTATLFNNGGNDSDSFSEVGWNGFNSAVVTNEETQATEKQTHAVGHFPPNAFGLYDMHGNVQEVCLDRYSSGDDYIATLASDYATGGVTVDPIGPEKSTTPNTSVKRGGSYMHGWQLGTSGGRQSGTFTYTGQGYCGFRLCCPACFE